MLLFPAQHAESQTLLKASEAGKSTCHCSPGFLWDMTILICRQMLCSALPTYDEELRDFENDLFFQTLTRLHHGQACVLKANSTRCRPIWCVYHCLQQEQAV